MLDEAKKKFTSVRTVDASHQIRPSSHVAQHGSFQERDLWGGRGYWNDMGNEIHGNHRLYLITYKCEPLVFARAKYCSRFLLLKLPRIR